MLTSFPNWILRPSQSLLLAALLFWSLYLGSTGCSYRAAEGHKFLTVTTGIANSADQGKGRFGPTETLVGSVVKVNLNGGFVVLNFPPIQLPRADVLLDVYRQGTKIGELRATSRTLDEHLIADILTGQPQPGDLAKTR